MERDVRYFFVGLCALLALAAFGAFLAWLAGTHDERQYKNYTVYFTDAVTGLTAGNDVRYKGVETGTVLGIRIAEDRPDLLKVDIQVSDNTPVRGGTVATLSMAGITGATYIDLETEANDTSPVSELPDEEYPVIQGVGTEFTRILKDVPAISRNVLTVTEKLNTLLAGDGIAALERIPQRLEETVAEINSLISGDNAGKISNILANAERLTEDMNGLLSEQNISNASEVLANAAEATRDFDKMTDKLAMAASEIESAARNLTEVIARNEENLNRLTKEGLSQVMRLSEESRQTAGAIRRLADRLGENPSQILYEPKYHGVEVPK